MSQNGNGAPVCPGLSPWLKGLFVTNLLPDVVAEGHVCVKFAAAEKVSLSQLPSQDTSFDQIDAGEVRDVPEAAEKAEGGGESTKVRRREMSPTTVWKGGPEMHRSMFLKVLLLHTIIRAVQTQENALLFQSKRTLISFQRGMETRAIQCSIQIFCKRIFSLFRFGSKTRESELENAVGNLRSIPVRGPKNPSSQNSLSSRVALCDTHTLRPCTIST